MENIHTSFLRCEKIEKSVTEQGVTRVIFPETSITFEQGKMYAITGSSGVGKTTFLHLLAGLDLPTFGKIMLNDRLDVARMTQVDRLWYRQSVVGLVFQFHYLVYELTVLENVMLPAQIRGLSSDDARAQAKKLIDFVGLSARSGAYPTTLSGGERQRVALARALVNKPAFILADEPTGSLDPENALKVKELLVAAIKEFNAGVIVVTHDVTMTQGVDVCLRL